MSYTPKDPDAVLDYPMDWGPWLAEAGDGTDALASCDVTITPVGDGALVADAPATVSSGAGDVARYVIVTLSGGVVGVTYDVRYRITTVGGLVDDRTRQIRIVQR